MIFEKLVFYIIALYSFVLNFSVAFEPVIKNSENFDMKKDAIEMRASLVGIDTNEAKIVKILTQRTVAERLWISNAFKNLYHRNLENDLKSDLAGDFEHFILSLMRPTPADFLASELYRAMKGFGTDEETLTEIIGGSTAEELQEIKSSYQKQYEKSLEAAVADDTSGNYRKLLVALLSTDRSTAFKTGIYYAEEILVNNKMSADNVILMDLLTSTPFEQISEVMSRYKKLTRGKTIHELVKSGASGDFQYAIQTIFECSEDRQKYFATILQNTLKKKKPDVKKIIRIFIWRAENDLGTIRDIYEKEFSKPLSKAISEAQGFKGDIKNGLMAIATGSGEIKH